MDSSKRTKPTVVGMIVRHILFFLLFYLVNMGLVYLLQEPDKYYSATAMKDAKENKGEINALIFGSSHTVYGIDPLPFDEILGWNTFNCGTMLQDLQGTYYYLKDMDRSNPIEHVILNLSYTSWASSYHNDTKSLIVLDRISSPFVYLEYAFDALSWDASYDLLFLPYRYRSNANIDQIKENVSGNWNKTYLYSMESLEGAMRLLPDKGFRPLRTIGVKNLRRVPSSAGWLQNEKSVENEEYLYKILDYCKSKGIEVILMSGPFSDAYVLQIKGYDEIRAYFNRFAEEYGIKYYDYNMIRKEYYRSDAVQFWADGHHMNFYGAQLFSRSFAGLLASAEAGEDVDALFYDNFQEYADAYDEIAGIRLRISDLKDGTYRLTKGVVLGNFVEAEYQVLARLEDEEEYTVIMDYSDTVNFVWEPSQAGDYRLRINARRKGSSKKYEVFNNTYHITVKSVKKE